MAKSMSHNIVSNVRKQAEYSAFIKLVRNGKIPANWEDMANALGVRPATISAWKKLPEFQKALLDGIDESFNNMTQTGKRQWQMWRERYAMLMQEKDKQANQTNIQVNVPVFNVMSDEAKQQLEKLYERPDRANH